MIPGKKGHKLYLQSINRLGRPVYVATVDNIISAATVRTSQLWAGGSTGLSLSGSSASVKGKIAIWDDEIQTFGRTTSMFAYEALDLGDWVDVFCIGKMTQACATLYTEEFLPAR